MSLTSGTRLGAYEITGPLGAGGMGEVYRARDTRLDRSVAIKVLPSEVGADPQFRARFDREARAISQLQHPHICTLYDVGEAGGTAYLVMELLQGQTLADRLTKGALPLDEALKIAIDVADALSAAHKQGIVHRDLKPANIMLTKTGAKLLDFGLAKAAGPIVSIGANSTQQTASTHLTTRGTILGTLHYMSPEQLEGREADTRSDIFAFGAIAYEMLAGKRAFEGTSQASLISAIMTASPPPISTLKPLVTPALDRVVQKCLAKEAEGRWQSVQDLRGELEWIKTTAGDSGGAPALRRRRPASVVVAWLLVAVLGGVIAVRSFRSAPLPDSPLVSFDVSTPPTNDPTSFALSPDGRMLAFVAQDGEVTKLWVRSMSDTVPHALPGTEGANYPFWKPDSRWIAFFADRKLKKISLAGDRPEILADANSPRGGTWSQQDVILFAPTTSSGLVRVPAGRGEVVPVLHAVGGRVDLGPRWPQFLPDGRRFLFYLGLATGDALAVYVGSLDGSEPTRILAADAAAWFTPPGHLLFVRQGSLMALPFDPITATVHGEPVTIARGTGVDTALRLPAFTAAQNGALAYRGGVSNQRRQLVWMNRTGQRVGTVGDPDNWASGNPELSPDGKRVAVHRTFSDNNLDVWLVDVARGVPKRFTTSTFNEINPTWSPDGNHLVYGSTRNGPYNIFQMAATDVGDGEPLFVTTSEEMRPLSWSSNSNVILYQTRGDKTGADLWVYSIADQRRWPVVQTKADESEGQFSPDGRWLAFVSTESGEGEVYVQPYPGPGEHQRVSTAGGSQVRWRLDSKELYYVASDNRLMAVQFAGDADGTRFHLGAPEPLFTTRLANGANVAGTRAQYAVASDGRFLMNVRIDDDRTAPITVVLNWLQELRRLVPAE
jgi:serine/threonine protein kinase